MSTIQVKKTKFKGKNSNLFVVILFTILALYTISLFFPLGWGLISSFKAPLDYMMGNRLGFPDLSMWDGQPIYTNYVVAWKNLEYAAPITQYYTMWGTETLYAYSFSHMSYSWDGAIGDYRKKLTVIDFILNTLLYAGSMAVISPAFNISMGYVVSRFKHYKLSTIIYTMVIFCMTTPIVGTGATLLNFLKNVGLFSKLWGELIKNLGWHGMYFLIIYAFYQGLSNTYYEAAEIDGASQFRIFTTIAIPLGKTLFFTIMLLIFTGKWSDYNIPLMYLPSMPTLSYAVYRFTRQTGQTADPNMPEKYQMIGGPSMLYYTVSAVMILVIPIIILFCIFKNKLMGNLTLGGIKE